MVFLCIGRFLRSGAVEDNGSIRIVRFFSISFHSFRNLEVSFAWIFIG